MQGVENDRGITIAGYGTVDIRFQVSPNSTHDIIIENVYHTPDFSANLISVGRLESKGLRVKFKNGNASVWNGKTLVMTATCVGSVYPIHMRANLPTKLIANIAMATTTKPSNPLTLWHQRLDHIDSATV